MHCRRSGLYCVMTSVSVLFSALCGVQATTLLSDSFTGVTSLNSDGWYFYNNASGGTAWNIGTDDATPLSGNVLNHPTGSSANTAALHQFTTTTLANIGDSIDLKLDFRNTNTSGAIFVSLFNTAASLTANTFGGTSPIADADGYSFSQYVSSSATTASIQKVTDLVSTNKATSTLSLITGDSLSHSYEFKLTLVSTGVQIDQYLDNQLYTTYTDTSSAYATFNTLQIVGSTNTTHFDNFSIVSVPEPGSCALIFAGMVGLAILGEKRKTS